MKNFLLFTVSVVTACLMFFTLRSNTKADIDPMLKGQASAEPFKLLNFDAKNETHSRIISWSDDDETVLDHFELQRSNSATEAFVTVYSATPQRKGNNTYSYSDIAPVSGNMVYYLLAWVEKDGYARFSNVIYAETDRNAAITLYPNPAIDHININFGMLTKRADIRIANQQGKTVMAISHFSGTNMLQDVTKLSGGMYFVEVVTENGISTTSFIKEGR